MKFGTQPIVLIWVQVSSIALLIKASKLLVIHSFWARKDVKNTQYQTGWLARSFY